jgi:hypothetical protein
LKIDQKSNYTVITGDIIGSSELNQKDRKSLHSEIKKIYSRLQSDFPKILPFPIDVFRGDSWQFIVADPSEALRIALCFRLLIKSGIYLQNIDTRMSVATGKISFISKNRISESDGEAFRISGKNLEKMKSNEHINIYIPNEKFQEHLRIIISLVDFIITKYTGKQSLAVYGMLVGMSQEEIRKLWRPPVSQPMVSGHLKSAGWFLIGNILNFYKNNV